MTKEELAYEVLFNDIDRNQPERFVINPFFETVKQKTINQVFFCDCKRLSSVRCYCDQPAVVNVHTDGFGGYRLCAMHASVFSYIYRHGGFVYNIWSQWGNDYYNMIKGWINEQIENGTIEITNMSLVYVKGTFKYQNISLERIPGAKWQSLL